MRLRTITTLLLAAGLAAGCGSDDDEQGSPIPAASAAELQDQLDSIQSRFEVPGGAACPDITEGEDTNTAVVQRVINGLPDDVDADLRDALEQSFQRLFELVERECGEKQEAEPQPEPEPVPEPETDTTETEPPPPVETTPTETVPEPPPATEEEPVLPPGQGGEPPGQGGENPGQGGGGGAVTPEDDG